MIIYVVLQFINVILGTLKTMTMTKSSKHIGAITNTLSFTFYAAVIKQMGGQKLWFVLVATFITNLVGFYVADFLFNKAQKDKLWRITATLPFSKKINSDLIVMELDKNGISFSKAQIDNGVVFDIYSQSQKESLVVKEILNKFPIKHSAIEISKAL